MIDVTMFQYGQICLIREFNGLPTVFKLIEPTRYREYLGCFSVYHNLYLLGV